MSEELILEDAEQTTRPSKGNPSIPKQKSTEDTDVTKKALESLKSDTSYTSRQHSEVPTDADEKCQQITTLEDVKQHTDIQCHHEKHSDEDTTRELTPMHSEQPCTTLTCTNEVIMPTEKVSCILVSSHLKQFLEECPSLLINKLS